MRERHVPRTTWGTRLLYIAALGSLIGGVALAGLDHYWLGVSMVWCVVLIARLLDRSMRLDTWGCFHWRGRRHAKRCEKREPADWIRCVGVADHDGDHFGSIADADDAEHGRWLCALNGGKFEWTWADDNNGEPT